MPVVARTPLALRTVVEAADPPVSTSARSWMCKPGRLHRPKHAQRWRGTGLGARSGKKATRIAHGRRGRRPSSIHECQLVDVQPLPFTSTRARPTVEGHRPRCPLCQESHFHRARSARPPTLPGPAANIGERSSTRVSAVRCLSDMTICGCFDKLREMVVSQDQLLQYQSRVGTALVEYSYYHEHVSTQY